MLPAAVPIPPQNDGYPQRDANPLAASVAVTRQPITQAGHGAQSQSDVRAPEEAGRRDATPGKTTPLHFRLLGRYFPSKGKGLRRDCE
jgi:hypothetical protein